MKPLVLVMCAAAGFVAGCGSTSPVAYCNNFVTEFCARQFECNDAATQATADFQTAWGTSPADCDAKLKASSCATVTNARPCATSAMSYHADKADACVADLKAASCATVLSGFMSDDCLAVCS
jgi:hypothetical protein